MHLSKFPRMKTSYKKAVLKIAPDAYYEKEGPEFTYRHRIYITGVRVIGTALWSETDAWKEALSTLYNDIQ